MTERSLMHVAAFFLTIAAGGAVACSVSTTDPVPAKETPKTEPAPSAETAPTQTTNAAPVPAPTHPDDGHTHAPAVDAGKCSKCSGVQGDPDFDPANLCSASQPLFEAVFACLCGLGGATPKCAAECAETACNADAPAAPSQECGNCAAINCGPQVGACLNDQ